MKAGEKGAKAGKKGAKAGETVQRVARLQEMEFHFTKVNGTAKPVMVALSTIFYFFRILFWLAMYHNFFSMLPLQSLNSSLCSKSFVKQNSICGW